MAPTDGPYGPLIDRLERRLRDIELALKVAYFGLGGIIIVVLTLGVISGIRALP